MKYFMKQLIPSLNIFIKYGKLIAFLYSMLTVEIARQKCFYWKYLNTVYMYFLDVGDRIPWTYGKNYQTDIYALDLNMSLDMSAIWKMNANFVFFSLAQKAKEDTTRPEFNRVFWDVSLFFLTVSRKKLLSLKSLIKKRIKIVYYFVNVI